MVQDTFLEEQLENIYLQEDLKAIINKIKAPARLKSIDSAVKSKKASNIVRALRFLPVLRIDTIKRISVKRVKDFDKNYKTVDRKLSPDTPPDKREWISTAIALMDSARDELKRGGKDVRKIDKIISQVKRPFYEKYEEELFSATLMAALVGVFSLVFVYVVPTVLSVVIWTAGAAMVVVMLGLFISSVISGFMGK
jgi:hypothetical protein